MKKMFKPFIDGVILFWVEDMLSFYTFITLAFAECVYAYIYQPVKICVPLIIILMLCIINLIISAHIIGECEGTVLEKIFSIAYVIIFAMLFIAACFVDILVGGMAILFPLGITILFMEIRKIQTVARMANEDVLSKILNNKVVLLLSRILIMAGPILTLIVLIALIPRMGFCLKVILIIISVLCAPFWVYIEDGTAAKDIFELGLETTYDDNKDDV